MLCERSHKPFLQKFLNQPVEDDDSEVITINNDKLDQLGHLPSIYGNHLNQERTKQLHTTSMNQLTFDLSGYGSELIGKCFEVQIELLDSYKRLHKSLPISQVLISPEFYGH